MRVLGSLGVVLGLFVAGLVFTSESFAVGRCELVLSEGQARTADREIDNLEHDGTIMLAIRDAIRNSGARRRALVVIDFVGDLGPDRPARRPLVTVDASVRIGRGRDYDVGRSFSGRAQGTFRRLSANNERDQGLMLHALGRAVKRCLAARYTHCAIQFPIGEALHFEEKQQPVRPRPGRPAQVRTIAVATVVGIDPR